MQSDLPKVCLALVLLAACTIAGTSSSVSVNFGEQLANGMPFKSDCTDEPHHKQIMSDKDLSSNKGIDPHTAGSELVQLGALSAIVWMCLRHVHVLPRRMGWQTSSLP